MLQTVLALLFAATLLAADLAPTGALRAVFLASNPVQARLDPKGGTYSGPVPDLINELARRLRVKAALIPAPDAGAVIDAITSGKADIGFLAYETARAAQVDFSEPYALMANAYAVRADSPIMRSADVDRDGIKVGAVKGQSQQIFVSKELKRARVDVLPLMPPNDALAQMLIRGDVDAFAANRQRMTELVQGRPQLRVVRDNFLMIGQAIVVAKGDAARLAEVNGFVAEIRRTGFVKASIDRAGLTAGVEPAR